MVTFLFGRYGPQKVKSQITPYFPITFQKSIVLGGEFTVHGAKKPKTFLEILKNFGNVLKIAFQNVVFGRL